MNSIKRIATAFAALQLFAALAFAGGGTAAALDGTTAVTRRAPMSQRSGRRVTRRRAPDALLPGTWGGQHVRFEVTEGGANVEFDCAHATLKGKILVNGAGQFSARGTYFPEHGGPVRADETNEGFPARFEGRVGGSLMKLTVTRVSPREDLGTFSLARDKEAEIFKCR
ncbi:MAG TPA: hypothetical protein VJ866_22835 [Pyrinomonadaceae bacterium]|nr:hypothetical protein [Pyrinomonadaceae bacterium]